MPARLVVVEVVLPLELRLAPHQGHPPHDDHTRRGRLLAQVRVDLLAVLVIGRFLHHQPLVGLEMLAEVDGEAAVAEELKLAELVEGVEGQGAEGLVGAHYIYL